MKQFDSRNIDKRAGKLLSYHIGLLENKNLGFISEGESYYLYKSNQEDYIKVGYNKTKKLLSRTFNLELKSVIHEIDFPDSFHLKLQFKGFSDIKEAYFAGNKNSKKYEIYFQDKNLINAILQDVRTAEIGYVHIQYNRSTKKMEITVCPYAGAYLWVVFPPAFFDMRLKKEEIYSVYHLMEVITNYVNKKLH